MKPLVSVIIPTKNSEKYLNQCLISIKNQTYKNIEIIIVDNFSQDKTLAIAQKCTRLIFQKGRERSTQINYGVKKAHGKYLYRVDSDFVVDQNHIKNMVEKCENENLDAIATFNRSDPNNSFWAKVRNFERDTYQDADLILASRFFSKKAFEKVEGFDDNLAAAEDYDLQYNLLKTGLKMGKENTADIHLGEPISIFEIAKKNYYYGASLGKYLKKHPKKGLQQMIPIRYAYLKHWRKFVRKPILTLGLLILKTVVYTTAFAGLLASKINENNKSFRHFPQF